MLFIQHQLMTWVERDPLHALKDLPKFIAAIEPLALRLAAEQIWKESVCEYAEQFNFFVLTHDMREYTC